jgi:hypothetical protein
MKVRKIIFTLAMLATLVACDKNFEDINSNQNVPTEVTPALLLAGVIRNTVNDQVNEAWGIGNIVIQHTAKIQFVNEDRYLWGDRTSIWSSVYGNLRNVQNIISIAETAEPVQNNYLGVALVLRAWMFANVTDAYGDVPFAEATKGKGGVYLPKYDDQQAVYNGILADLKRANELLGTSAEAVSGDLIYNGSIIQWKRFANSLRVRYLMRISSKTNVSADLQAIVADPASTPLFENNSQNAALVYSTAAPNQWPLYGSRVGSFDEFRLSKTLGDALTAMNDPRLSVFGRATEKSVVAGTPVISGVPNGLEDTQALSYNGGPQGVSRVGLSFACLVCNDSGKPAPVANVARGLIMTYAELQFLLAEAREKSLITTGAAATYYTAGINANFDFYRSTVPAEYGVDLTTPPSYFTQPLVAYTGTTNEKLEKIGRQKWVALFFNGLEAWYDWRRTGLPVLAPGVSNLNNNKIPVRMQYPVSEQTLNAESRVAAVSRQGSDDINTAVWWDK